MKYGTSHFESFEAAVKYYQDYSPGTPVDGIREWVENKLSNGEIHIGKPQVQPGQTLILDMEERRYFIQEEDGKSI